MPPHDPWKRSDPALVDRFDAALPDHPAAQRRTMFGYPACFVNGHYFAGLHEDRVVIRLPGDIHARVPELSGAASFDPMRAGKPMKDWYEIPPDLVADPDRLAALLAATIEEVARLPPKEPKKRRR
jgi:TfoX/Sxy family transcriptional regulator of competence genes